MSDKPYTLEILPNEVFLELFQYFDARDLFQIFHHLNPRFDSLIQSFHQLRLVYEIKCFTDNQIEDEDLFPRYTYTLIVGRAVNVDLRRFNHIRCLKSECPLPHVRTQLNTNVLPFLQHLSISQLGITRVLSPLSDAMQLIV